MEKLEKDNYTKEEVQKFLNDVETKLTDVTTKLTNVSTDYKKAQEQVKELDKLKKENLSNSIKLEMSKNGISDNLFDLVQAENLETAKSKITKLVELNKKNKIDNSYKPEDKEKKENEYEVAEKKGNVEGMLKSKLSKIFQ